MIEKVEIDQFYMHRDGGIYVTLHVSSSTVDQSQHVVYRHVFPFEVKIWHRPIEEWDENRFTKITKLKAHTIMTSNNALDYQAVVKANKSARKGT